MDFTSMLFIFFIGLSTAIFGIMVGSSGLIRIPILILMGFPPQVAIASDKIGTIAMASIGIYKYNKEKLIDYRVGSKLIILEIIGAIIGAKILIALNPTYLNKIIAIIIFIVVGIVLFKQNLGLEVEKNKPRKYLISGFILYFILSIYGGFIGGGAGTIGTIIIICFFGLTFLKSAATRRLPGLVGAVTAAIVFAFNGLINWPLAAILFVGQGCGAWIGSTIAIKKGNMFVKIVFVIMAILLAIKLLTT